jgi:membrane protease YdiL (CAAX protease family)
MLPIAAPYHAMNQLADLARPRVEIWRTVLGLILSEILTVLIVLTVVLPMMKILGPTDPRDPFNDGLNSNSAAGVIGLLFSFLPQMLGLILAVQILMRRGLSSLTGPFGPVSGDFIRVGLPLMGLLMLLMPLSVQGDDVRQNLTLAQLLPWLPAALLGLLIQTTTEELMFRGYLQQQLAGRFSARWVWLGLPTLLFGLAHYAPHASGLMTAATMFWAAGFGLIAADLTARTGNLGAAIALHFTNNVSAILIVGLAGDLGGLTLYQVQVPADDIGKTLMYLGLDGLGLLVSWLLARLILRC